jgi:2-iminobutanoate/2-iminopropanoate deaminase
MRTPIVTTSAPAPRGVYSQAIVAEGRLLFVSGQGPSDPATGELVLGSFREQAERTFRNVGALLTAGGTSWANVAKVNVYLADMKDFQAMNEVYRTFAVEPYPARTTVGAALGVIAIEVDCVAVIPAP